jgi:general secretion pathway protein J
MPRTPSPIRTQGFTLLELLVAIAIFAVMMVLAYGGLKSILDSRAETERQATRLAALQRSYTILQRDITQLSNRSIRDAYGDRQPALAATPGIDGYLEFTHSGWSNPAYARRSTLQRVAYSLKDGKLQRLVWPVLDRVQQTPTAEVSLLDQVEAMELRYLDNQGKWSPDWPPLNTEAGANPPSLRALEFNLDLEDLGRITWLFAVADGTGDS